MSTDIYSREELCIKHLVKIYFDPPDEELYYFDFRVNEWIRCYIKDRLPYNLFTFVLEGMSDDQCVCTSCNRNMKSVIKYYHIKYYMDILQTTIVC